MSHYTFVIMLMLMNREVKKMEQKSDGTKLNRRPAQKEIEKRCIFFAICTLLNIINPTSIISLPFLAPDMYYTSTQPP